MAEITYTIGISPPEESLGSNEIALRTDTPMTEEIRTTTPTTQEPETLILQVPSTEAPLQPMPVHQAFAPDDLAMESNPMTTAEVPPVDNNKSTLAPPVTATAAEPPPVYSHAYGNAPELLNQPETSATGWLVPPAAAPVSRITFDGTLLQFVSIFLIMPQMHSIRFDIETFLQLKNVFPHLMLWESDYLTLSEITFEWGDSYDCKDWKRLGAILAPTLMVDYTEVNGHKWDSMPATDFVGIMSHIGFVGDPLVHTQHHIGASKWVKVSDSEVIGHHQLRAAHQRYTNLDLNTVENKGHGHAMVKHYYRKVNGEWKLAGLRPAVRWNEFEFDKIFKGF